MISCDFLFLSWKDVPITQLATTIGFWCLCASSFCCLLDDLSGLVFCFISSTGFSLVHGASCSSSYKLQELYNGVLPQTLLPLCDGIIYFISTYVISPRCNFTFVTVFLKRSEISKTVFILSHTSPLPGPFIASSWSVFHLLSFLLSLKYFPQYFLYCGSTGSELIVSSFHLHLKLLFIWESLIELLSFGPLTRWPKEPRLHWAGAVPEPVTPSRLPMSAAEIQLLEPSALPSDVGCQLAN